MTFRGEMAMQFECRKVALKQDKTGFVLTLCLHPDEIPEELLRDFVGARYAVAMVRVQDDEQPTEYRNRTQQAAILCKNLAFQHWVGVTSEQAAAEAVCKRCDIESRSELNGNKQAQAKFDQMIKEYDNADPFL
jgi:hypothetical protein